MEKEILRLFRSYLGEKTSEISEEGLKCGLLIPKTANDEIVKEAIKQYGKDGEKWNQTFHKDFEIVKNAPIEDLIAQQLIHYITTYGFESLGFYDSDIVYIPKEKLEIPEIKEDIEMITIQPLTETELTEKIMIFLTSGIALSEQTIKDIMVLSNYIDKNRFDEISNREIKIALYDKYNIMPRNPEEFLKYLIFKATNSTMKIQSDDMINAIKRSDKNNNLKMFKSYLEKTPNGYNKLASIFLRNKNLFLAFKIKKSDYDTKEDLAIRIEMNAIINKLKKLSAKNHIPLKKNVLDCLTDDPVMLTKTLKLQDINKVLDDSTIFREARILNGISYRLYGNSDDIIYKIRNGKSFVSKIKNKDKEYKDCLEKIYSSIHYHLIERLKEKVDGKTICIPDNVTYSVPTSEKQFNGNFPEGSYVEVPRDDNLIYGIHWKNIEKGLESKGFYGEMQNTKEERVDLDLKQMNKNEVFGWDASYRGNGVYFSGDMTDAKLPNGATELFYIDKEYGQSAFLITLNMYTSNSQDVPFEFVIAKATHKPDQRVYYAIDPNNILTKIDMKVKKTERQMVVGFITIGDTVRFYFNDFSAGNNITSRQNNITTGAFEYLQAYSKTQLKLKDLLTKAGAEILSEPIKVITTTKVDEDGNEWTHKEEVPVDIDLSPNTITKETLIDLLS